MEYKKSLLIVFVLFLSLSLFSQEEAPLKTFDFTISLNHLKTEEQASKIKNEVIEITGVENCELILVDYVLSFRCTNHDLKEYMIMDRVKEIIVSNGAEIIQIKRTEI